MTLTTATLRCNRCKCDQSARLAQFIAINRSIHVAWQCEKCGGVIARQRANGIWIPHEELVAKGVQPHELPVARNDSGPRCARCGVRGAEEHHWAPRHLFKDEADDWPKDFLCGSCHKRWHQVVTPGMCDS